MKVKPSTLLLIACLVWTAAGFNILRIGWISYPGYGSAVNFLLSAVVFGLFQAFVFGRLVKKHTARIWGYGEERQFFLKFFDGKSFAIMAFMMAGESGCGPAAWHPSGSSPSFIPVWGRPCCWRGCCSAGISAGPCGPQPEKQSYDARRINHAGNRRNVI